ncbi:hypothetical protein GCM10010422_27620 [Streptomyces graminearus]|uniref:Uncharacterized protein n=1 Tax=Streptomyces graminearus TaxID=284030 RepID=A0ABN3LBY2_9ACTN
MSWGTSPEMRCRGTYTGKSLSGPPGVPVPADRNPTAIQALSSLSARPGSRGGNPHRDMGRRPGRRPVGGPASQGAFFSARVSGGAAAAQRASTGTKSRSTTPV